MRLRYSTTGVTGMAMMPMKELDVALTAPSSGVVNVAG